MSRACWKATREKLLETFSRPNTQKRDARFRPFTRLLLEAESLNRLSGFSFYHLSTEVEEKEKGNPLVLKSLNQGSWDKKRE